MSIFDLFLSGFGCYRRLRGGVWTLIGPSSAMPHLGFMWVKGLPISAEKAYAYESYR